MDSAKEIRKLRKKIEKVQDAKRFEHTLGVEYTAAADAMCYGAAVEDARREGVLSFKISPIACCKFWKIR